MATSVLCRILSVLLLVSATSVCADPQPNLSGNAPVRDLSFQGGERKVSFSLQNPRLPDVMAELSRHSGLSIVADAYGPDYPVRELNIVEVPLSVAVRELASLYEREAFVTDGVIVMRHRFWATHIRRPVVDPTLPKPVSAGELTLKEMNGTRTLAGSVKNTTVGVVCRQVTQSTGVKFSAQPPLLERPVSIFAADLTTTQLAGAIGELFNGSAEVTIKQSREQREREDALDRQMQDTRSPSRKVSDELRAELAKLLTPEDLQVLKSGQRAPIPVERLPAKVRKFAENYARMRASEKLADFQIDWNKDISVVFSPDAREMIGVDAFLTDGGLIHF